MLPQSQARIARVSLRNYRSIAGCTVDLGPLTFLVGPNGAGKSNFLDALRLVRDSLRTTLDHALRERSGIAEVRRRSSGHPMDLGIGLHFVLPGGVTGHLAFDIGARPGGYVVKKEECVVGKARYLIAEGQVVHPAGPVAPPAVDDRLYLVSASGLPEFRPAYDLLSHMGLYNINPEQIRALQPPDKGELLERDGRNLASVLERLRKTDVGIVERIEQYLSRIVPDLTSVSSIPVGHMETLEFRQRVKGAKQPWRLNAINMSDGTLRALGILVALFQAQAESRIPVVAIEEPEVALHPAAAGLLRDALVDASRSVQVVVTSHSPELLDDPGIIEEQILAVSGAEGVTHIDRIDEASRTALKDRLYTAGELLRSNQLAPERRVQADSNQLKLFDENAP